MDAMSLVNFYNTSYFKNPDSRFGYEDYLADENAHRKNANILLSMLPISEGELLDIGCAHGFLLDEAKEKFFTCGIDVSKEAVDFARTNGLDVGQGRAEELPYKNKFDVVVLNGVIEHFENPFKVLEEVNRVLKTGGYLLISTVDVSGIVKLFKLYHEKFPEHLFFFSRQSLKEHLKTMGFSCVKCGIFWKYYRLSDFLKRLSIFFKLPSLNFNSQRLVKIPTNESVFLFKKES